MGDAILSHAVAQQLSRNGFLVLCDLPKEELVLDGKYTIRLRGGFRGFRNVPAGKHRIVLKYDNETVSAEVDISEGDATVMVYSDGRLCKADEDRADRYRRLATSFAMGDTLFPWPRDAFESKSVDTTRGPMQEDGTKALWDMVQSMGVSPEIIEKLEVGAFWVDVHLTKKLESDVDPVGAATVLRFEVADPYRVVCIVPTGGIHGVIQHPAMCRAIVELAEEWGTLSAYGH